MHRLLLLLTVIVAGAFAPATGAPPRISTGGANSIGIRLLEAPVALENDPRARIYIIDHVSPGTTLTRQVQISSTSDSPSQVHLYGGPATINGGTFSGGAVGQSNELSSWISVTPAVVTIPPHGDATATATIAVPANASSGERYGVVWAQLPTSTGNGGVAIVNRVGIRVYLSVGNGPAPKIDFTINSLTAGRDTSGAPYVTASVHNTGGRALDLSGTLTLNNGPGGTRAGPFPAKLGTTLGIGQTEPVTVPLDKAIPAGPWSAVIDLTSDEATREATATITFPAGVGTSATPVTVLDVHRRSGGLLHASAIVLIIPIALAFLIFLLWRGRRKRVA